MTGAARLVFPALRWRATSGFEHEQPRIDATLKAGVGGYILFGGRAERVRKLTEQLQSASAHPLLIGSDLERGPGQQFEGLTQLPSAAALGFLNKQDLARTCAEITAKEARSVGVNWVYAPVADLDVEPENPIVQTRSFGDDPAAVSALVAAWVSGAERNGVAAAVKHFPGHGRTTLDSHATLPVVTTPFAELEKADLEPFRAAVQAGVRSVMTAHVAYPGWDASGVPATMSPVILGYLREAFAFTGPIVTDAFIMEGALKGRGPNRAAVDAIGAGCDALLYPSDSLAVAAALDRSATEPRMRGRIDQAAERVGALAEAMRAAPVQAPDVPADRAFADAAADLAVHTLRGDTLRLFEPLSISMVDDDVGGPYLVGPRGNFAKTVQAAGVRIAAAQGSGSRVTVIFSEPRSWKGRALLGERSLLALKRVAGSTALYVLFGHPRLLPQIPGDAPVVCAWHGQTLMQDAAARWVSRRFR